MEDNSTATQQFELINPSGDLTGSVSGFLSKNGIQKIGKNYHFVAIIGCQSTGKSTLLNRLFGTTFSTMDSAVARKQTTRGVIMSKDQQQPVFILDIEGSDSKERWEERGPFEQSTALFALVLSHVMMINMFTGEVGRFTASNYGVLRVIFEQNLKLFAAQGSVARKKKVVFILRDFAEGDNLAAITETIKDDIYTIWQEISKPKEFQNSFYDKFFHIEFVTLSHFKFAKQAFENDVKELRAHFVDPQNDKYYFRDVQGCEDNIPADALETFMQQVWSTIRSSKDINLPNQKKMVATFRCTEILNDILKEMQQYIDQITEAMKSEDYKDFGADGQALLKRAITRYTEETQDYDKEVVEQTEQDLVKQLSARLFEMFTARVTTLRKQLMKNIQAKLSERVDTTNPSNLMKNVRDFKEQQITWFKSMIANAVVPDQDWKIATVHEEAETVVNELLNSYKEKQLSFFMKSKESKLKRELENEISALFDNLDINFWQNLEKSAEQLFSRAENEIKTILITNFEMPFDKVFEIMDIIKDETFKNLENDLRNKISDLNYYLIKKFRNIFNRSETGVPINWKLLKEPEIEERYTKYRQIMLDVLQKMRVFELKAGNLTESLNPLDAGDINDELLNQKEFQTIKSRFEDDMEIECKEAIKKHNASDMTTIPKWLWFVLIYFMYDDILRWLKNPLLLYPVLLLFSVIVLLFTIGYGHLPRAFFSIGVSTAKATVGGKLKKVGVNL